MGFLAPRGAGVVSGAESKGGLATRVAVVSVTAISVKAPGQKGAFSFGRSSAGTVWLLDINCPGDTRLGCLESLEILLRFSCFCCWPLGRSFDPYVKGCNPDLFARQRGLKGLSADLAAGRIFVTLLPAKPSFANPP